MKILLAVLMCLVLGTTECFALKGGPVYPASTNLVGTYAGVMQGVFDPTNPASSNSIGIFSLGVPSTGNASGAFIMFSRGRVFTGTAQAFADPVKSQLKGILSASYNYTLIVPVTTTSATGTITTTFDNVDITATANGPIEASVKATVASSFGTSTITLLQGEATLSISQGGIAANGDPIITGVLALVVSGVKQSNTVSAASVITGGG